MIRCQNIRTVETKGVPPGKWRTHQCYNRATRQTRVHQTSEHPRVGDGWFMVALCQQCFLHRSDANAVVNRRWRWVGHL